MVTPFKGTMENLPPNQLHFEESGMPERMLLVKTDVENTVINTKLSLPAGNWRATQAIYV